MKKNRFDKSFWNDRYHHKDIGWDLTKVSTPIKTYIDQLDNKDLKILVPGAGNSYEAEYLWKQGFKNVSILDIAQQPLKNFTNRVAEFPKAKSLNIDFFKLTDTFDLIIEQTFFCTLEPKLRATYVEKVYNSLNTSGKLVGLLFDFELTEKGPPFGGNKAMYLKYFEKIFNIKILEPCYNSMDSRKSKELFFIFEKKQL